MDKRALRKQLLAERERLEHEIAELDADLSESLEDSSEESPYDQHMAETAAVTLDRERSRRPASREDHGPRDRSAR